MADCETNLDASEFYHSALDNLMISLQINSTPSSSSTCCNTSFQRHFNSANESQFFAFCSTLKQYSKHKKCQNTNKMEQSDESIRSLQQNVADTPKRAVFTARKLKLFETAQSGKKREPETLCSLSEREMSSHSLLLKRAIAGLECVQHGQQTSAPNKKPMRRTSLRV